MDKEEILKSYRSEGVDEGRNNIILKSNDAGFYALIILALILMIYKIFRNLSIGDILALLFVFITSNLFTHYRLEKNKATLSWLIVNGLLTIASLVWYLVETL